MIEIKLIKGVSFTVNVGEGKKRTKEVFLKEKPRYFANDHAVVNAVKKQIEKSSEARQKPRFALVEDIANYRIPFGWEKKAPNTLRQIVSDLGLEDRNLKKHDDVINVIKSQIEAGTIIVNDEKEELTISQVVNRKEHDAKVRALQDQINKLEEEANIKDQAYKKMTADLMGRIEKLEGSKTTSPAPDKKKPGKKYGSK